MDRFDIAQNFFKACEDGAGWEGCAEYCLPDAGFSAQAGAIDDLDTLAGYCDWMQSVYARVSDISYEVKGFADDASRQTVLVFAVFSGIPKGVDAPKRFFTDYVYSIQFDGDRISHMVKIWNDTYKPKS